MWNSKSRIAPHAAVAATCTRHAVPRLGAAETENVKSSRHMALAFNRRKTHVGIRGAAQCVVLEHLDLERAVQKGGVPNKRAADAAAVVRRVHK